MLKTIQILFVVLTVFAVGVMQAVGVQAGYLCGCTGEMTGTADCAGAVCHPLLAHGDGCDENFGHGHGAMAGNAGCEVPGSHDSQKPGQQDHDHKHHEIREPLVATTFPPGTALPPVLCFVLPPVFELPEFVLAIGEPDAVSLLPRPPDDKGPLMCLLVAETTVLLV